VQPLAPQLHRAHKISSLTMCNYRLQSLLPLAPCHRIDSEDPRWQYHTRMHAHTHAHTQAHTCTHTHAHVNTRLHANLHPQAATCAPSWTTAAWSARTSLRRWPRSARRCAWRTRRPRRCGGRARSASARRCPRPRGRGGVGRRAGRRRPGRQVDVAGFFCS